MVGRQHKNTDTNPCQSVLRASGEALIQSLSAFILEILCNARNGMTRIASYLRNPMTKQYIKFLIKADSVNESVLPRNQAPTLSIQESPAAALNLSSGNAGSCCKGWYPCFCFVVKLFYESAESVPTSLGPGKSRRGNREPVYRDSWLSYLSKLHSGRNIRDIHDRWEQNPSMEFPDFFLHTFILHKPLIFTTSR